MRIITLIAVIAAVFGTAGSAFCQGLRFAQPRIEGFHPLDDEPYAMTQISSANPVALKMQSSLFKDTSIVDFEKRQITFQRYDQLGFIIWEYHYGELSDYLLDRRNYGLTHSWYVASMPSGKNAGQNQGQAMRLEWELPVQYPSWAQRVLGKDPPRLTIDGALKIKISYEDTRVQRQKGEESDQTGPGFSFENTSRFSIRGSVGRLISINISANSEEGFEMDNPLKNFKIEYKESTPGELEDEIVQEVVAGYTGFEMPASYLSGYSESHEGLFGIKIKSKLGPVTLTTIASNEQGEAQKITRSGKSSGGVTTISENEYLENKYFFLDTVYRSYYNRKYFNPKTTAPSPVSQLQIWRKVNDPQRLSTLLNDPTRKVMKARLGSSNEDHDFELLIENTHYRIYKNEGWIRLVDSITLQNEDMLGIYMRNEDGSIVKGDTTVVDSINHHPIMQSLWVLKDRNPPDSSAADSTYDLMWRNVYQLPEFGDLASFKLKVYYKSIDGGDSSYYNESRDYYSDVLGLTDKGVTLTDRSYIFDIENHVLIIPPFDSTIHGNNPFANPGLGQKEVDTAIYFYNKQAPALRDNYTPKFKIEMTGSSKQTTFDLGYGVMANTDIVKSSVGRLNRNEDYTINYEMGTLELTSAKAKAADNVEIEYQREALFVPEKKVFLGAHGRIDLPFISEKSFLGSSILYQSASSTKDIPRIGQEPYSKMLLDVNTHIDFEPEWMTMLVNKLPLVKTTAPSSTVLEFEIAHSRMNPNTDGQAYIDDFEGSKVIYDLPSRHTLWRQASPPFSSRYMNDSLLANPPAWDFYWFSPVEEDKLHHVFRDSIWIPDANDIYSGREKYETVMRLHCRPAPVADSLKGRYRNAWAGIMTSIPQSFSDLSKNRYIEFLAKVNGSGNGKLKIQLGEILEDVSLHGGPPDGVAEYEDTNRIRYDWHDDNLDRGLDTVRDSAEYYVYPNAGLNGWDTLKLRDPLLPLPLDPSKDNFKKYDNDNTKNFRYVNGTESDGYLTSEDINNDGTVDKNKTERYFTFTLDLADTVTYVDKAAKVQPGKGWHLYRIPLRDFVDSTNGPSWKHITMTRLIWTGFDSSTLSNEHQIMFTQMQFVGNQWEAVPVKVSDSLSIVNIEPSVINTKENKEYENSLGTTSHITRGEDETGHPRDEQSLKLNFYGLHPGDSAIVRRNISYQALNLSSYNTLSLLVHGDTAMVNHPDLRFIFRFGSDDSTYYEYRTRIKQGWDNFINIDLRAFSEMKLEYTRNHEGARIDTTTPDGTLSIRSPPSRQPNFSNIIFMSLGIIRDLSNAYDSLNGEIWVDELKVVGIKALNGFAARASFNTKFADLISVDALMNYKDGDFRSMTNNEIIAGSTELSGNIGASIAMDKFLPQEWGVAIPFGGSLSGSLKRPQLKPGTDIYVNNDKTRKPDNFTDMAADAVNMIFGKKLRSDTTKAEHFEEQLLTETVYSSYEKRNKSENPFVNLTVDRISTDARYNYTKNKVLRGEKPESEKTISEQDYFSVDSNTTYTGRLKYDLTPSDPPSWTKWKPFGVKPPEWIPVSFKSCELSMLPDRLNFDVYDFSYGYDFNNDTKLNAKKVLRTFDLRHGFQFSYTPISSILDLDYNLGVTRDLKNVAGFSGSDFRAVWDTSIIEMNDTYKRYFVLYGEKNRSQQLTLKTNPQFFSWLTHSTDYTVDYKGDMVKGKGNDSTDYINAGIHMNLNFSASFNTSDLFRDFSTLKGIGTFFGAMQKGFDQIGFKSISFTYNAVSDLKNNFMDTSYLNENLKHPVSDFLIYQFGVKDRTPWDLITGDMDDSLAFGGMRYRSAKDSVVDHYQNDTRGVTRTFRLSTSFKLPSPIDISFNTVSFGWGIRYGTQPAATTNDTSLTMPDLNITASTELLQKFGFVNDYVQNANVSSSFTLKKTYTFSAGRASNDTSSLIDWTPLVGVDGTVKKWPVRFSYRHNQSKDQRQSAGKTVTTKNSDNLDLNYDIDQSSKFTEIKLLTWTVPVSGKTSTGVKFSREGSKTVTKDQESNNESSFALTPHLSYVFTNNVTGTLEYTFSSKEINGMNTTSNLGALTVDIQF